MELKAVSEECTTGPTTSGILPLHPHDDNMVKVTSRSFSKYKEKTPQDKSTTAFVKQNSSIVIETLSVKYPNEKGNCPESEKIDDQASEINDSSNTPETNLLQLS